MLLDSVTLAISALFHREASCCLLERCCCPVPTAGCTPAQIIDSSTLPTGIATKPCSCMWHTSSQTIHFYILCLGCQLITCELPTNISKTSQDSCVDSTVSAPLGQVMLRRGVSLIKDPAKGSKSYLFWQARRIALLDALDFREIYKFLALLLASACRKALTPLTPSN